MLVEADDLTGDRLDGASVTVRSGEIVGLAGLLGSGRTEVARAIFGADPASGDLRVRGKTCALAIAAGCHSGRARTLRRGSQGGRHHPLHVGAGESHAGGDAGALPPRHRRPRRAAADRRSFHRPAGIKTSGPEQTIRELSGGNQQKVLLARWLCLNPSLLLLDEPTRGIDVGAKAEIQELIDELADDGLGVLMISSELEEITEGADRVVVLREGRTVAEFDHAHVSQDTDHARDGAWGDESRSRESRSRVVSR